MYLKSIQSSLEMINLIFKDVLSELWIKMVTLIKLAIAKDCNEKLQLK